MDINIEHVEKKFLNFGGVVLDAYKINLLSNLRIEIVKYSKTFLKDTGYSLREDYLILEDEYFLNKFHEILPVNQINEFRMSLFSYFNSRLNFREEIYRLAEGHIDAIVGSDLAMQTKVNFSIQMPGDKSSTLDMHADSFTGETPYQVVLWIPFVDVYETKSMFFLCREQSNDLMLSYNHLRRQGISDIMDHVSEKLHWFEMKFGQYLVFSPNFLHGNVINNTTETRWSLNVRFVNNLAPFPNPDRGIGTFFHPLKLKPATILGLSFQSPIGISD